MISKHATSMVKTQNAEGREPNVLVLLEIDLTFRVQIKPFSSHATAFWWRDVPSSLYTYD